MGFDVSFLGSAYFNSVHYWTERARKASDSQDLDGCADNLLLLSGLASKSFNSYMVRWLSPGTYRARMVGMEPLAFLQTYRQSIEGIKRKPFYDLSGYAEALARFGDQVDLTRRELPSAVLHTTLREWLYPLRGCAKESTVVDAQAYQVSDACVVDKVIGMLRSGHDIYREWLVPVLAYYKGHDMPSSRVTFVSLGRDLHLLYEAQARHAGEQDFHGGVANTLPIKNASLLVASAFSNWVADGVFAQTPTTRVYSSSAYWARTLRPFGAHVIHRHEEHDSPQKNGTRHLTCGTCGDNHDYLPWSPLLLSELAYPNLDLSVEVFGARATRSYDFCVSLDDLVDAATDPFISFPTTLVCSVQGGWFTLLSVDGDTWDIRYLELADGAGSLRLGGNSLGQPRAYELGSIPLSLSSGKLRSHLVALASGVSA